MFLDGRPRAELSLVRSVRPCLRQPDANILSLIQDCCDAGEELVALAHVWRDRTEFLVPYLSWPG